MLSPFISARALLLPSAPGTATAALLGCPTTGWVVQLNGDAIFGFCLANIDMIALDFCSYGGSNDPLCFSYILHQTEGEKLHTVTFYEMQSAVMAVLKAKTEKDCEFSTYIKRPQMPITRCHISGGSEVCGK